MSRVQTAVLHLDTLQVDYNLTEGQPNKEQFASYVKAHFKLTEKGYTFTGGSSALRQKTYMRAVDGENEIAEQ